MESPITGKPMALKKEKATFSFRKEPFEVVQHFYLCEDRQETFTTTALDKLNMKRLQQQYRARHGSRST